LSFLIHAIVCCQYSHHPTCHFCWRPFSCPIHGGKHYFGFNTPISPCRPSLSIHSLKTNLYIYIYIYILWFHPNTLPLVLVPFHAHLSFELLFSHTPVPCHSSWCSLLFSSSPIIFHCELVVPHHPLVVVCHFMLSLIAILIFYVIIGVKLKHPQIL
jgi:hypothetical protein